MRIDRCTCFNQTFAALKARAGEHGSASIESLQKVVAFGHNCRLCHPYVRRMLATGQTVFHEVLTEDDEPAD